MKKKIAAITSGDELVDWFFRAMIFSLNEEVEEIKWAHYLNGNNSDGTWSLDSQIISLNDYLDGDEKLKTFIHEVCHTFLDLTDLEEKLNLDLEKILWKKLSGKQKKILLMYIPPKPRCEKCQKVKKRKLKKSR